MFSFDVLTVGAATQDVFLESQKFEKVRDPSAPEGFDACFPMGAKIGVDDIIFSTGGGATNAAVTFSRFGLKSGCLSRVGDDPSGETVIEALKKDRVNTKLIQLDKKFKTAYSVILLSGAGHRSILTYRGAAMHLSHKLVPWKNIRTRWLYVTSLGGNLVLLRALFAFAKTSNARIAWNPGNAELEYGWKTLSPFLGQVDVLNLNREEAAVLTHLPKRDLRPIMNRLNELGANTVVITDGQHGANVHSDGFYWHAPASSAKRVNTTGAGDAFGSAFVAMLARSRS